MKSESTSRQPVKNLVFLFLERTQFPRNESIASIVWKRYRGEISKSFRKFEKMDYKLRKAKLDINFLIKCQRENIIPNFLKFHLANNKIFEILLPILNVNRIACKQKLTIRNHVWELWKMNLIFPVMIYNLAWTVLILPTFLPFFLVAMIIF